MKAAMVSSCRFLPRFQKAMVGTPVAMFQNVFSVENFLAAYCELKGGLM